MLASLQGSINRIWNIEASPGHNIRNWVFKRILSLGMLLVFWFLLVVSLTVSAALSLLLAGTGNVL